MTERIREIAKLLAEREWYAYKARIHSGVGPPCVDDFSNLALCLGRKISNEECDLFTEAWNARITEYCPEYKP